MPLNLNIKLKREAFYLEADLNLDHPVTGLFGPSGSGKTSLLSVIAGLDNPHSGKIELDNVTLYDSEKKINIPPHLRKIGYVFQDSQLFPHLSVKQNLLYGYRLVPENKKHFQPDQIIDLLDIGSLLSRRPRNLSGGEKQRVAMGRTLLASPKLLLMDEPLASLDEGLKNQILPFLKRVKDELHVPMLYVSHIISEILQLTDKLVVLEKGSVLAYGSFLDIIKKEQILNLAESLGLENVIPATVLSNDPDSGFTILKIKTHQIKLSLSGFPPGEKTFVAVRPEDIILAREPVTGTSVQNQLEGRIEGVTLAGNRALVHVNIGETILAEVTIKASRELDLKEGGRIFCLIKSRSFSYISGRNI